MKSTFWITITVLFFIGGGLAMYATLLQHPSVLTPRELSPSAVSVTTPITPVKSLPLSVPAGTAVTLDGELVCLPLRAKRQERRTLECARGLRTTEGKHYALENINPYIIEGKVLMGQRVKVNGLLRSYTETKYDTIGIIYVTSVDKLD